MAGVLNWRMSVIVIMVGVVACAGYGEQPKAGGAILQQVDHLVYATPDLDAGIARIEVLLGVRATPGGQHVDLPVTEAPHPALVATIECPRGRIELR
jgi:Glyoxalase-like domain